MYLTSLRQRLVTCEVHPCYLRPWRPLGIVTVLVTAGVGTLRILLYRSKACSLDEKYCFATLRNIAYVEHVTYWKAPLNTCASLYPRCIDGDDLASDALDGTMGLTYRG